MHLEDKKFHFIAIGGVGMSALAKYLAERGAKVSGSDIQESKYTHLLEEKGVKVTIGHSTENIEEDMLIVASTAIKNTNPEILRAKELGLKIYHRSDILKMISDEFSQNKNSFFFGYSVTHGKTTTSGMCAYVLNKAGLKPSYVVGGIIPELNTNGEFADIKYFSAELDESDGTLEKYATDIAVINNIEEDHLDFYKNGFPDIIKTFNKYLSNKPTQKVVINTDNEGNKEFIKNYPNYNYISFGKNNADYTIRNIKLIDLGSEFDIYYKEQKLDTLKLTVLGEHNVYNATGVYIALREANVDVSLIKQHFTTFSGMGRRFQKVSEFNEIKIYDDYAHHPSEIKTTLDSLKNAVQDRNRVIAVFQPHRYSRLKGLWEEFKTAFDSADLVYVTDVYSAGEDKIEGTTSENFVNELKNDKFIYSKGNLQDNAQEITNKLKAKDIIVTLGAGTITKLGNLIEEEHKICQ